MAYLGGELSRLENIIGKKGKHSKMILEYIDLKIKHEISKFNDKLIVESVNKLYGEYDSSDDSRLYPNDNLPLPTEHSHVELKSSDESDDSILCSNNNLQVSRK